MVRLCCAVIRARVVLRVERRWVFWEGVGRERKGDETVLRTRSFVC